MSFNIRPMVEQDFASIAQIQEDITKINVSPQLENILRGYMEKDQEACLVAEDEGAVVGYVIGDVKDWGFGLEKSGWVEILGVHPKYMGQGIGKELGYKLVAYFRIKDIKNVYTAVRWDSGDLLAFFKSIGFDRSDLIILERRLD